MYGSGSYASDGHHLDVKDIETGLIVNWCDTRVPTSPSLLECIILSSECGKCDDI